MRKIQQEDIAVLYETACTDDLKVLHPFHPE